MPASSSALDNQGPAEGRRPVDLFATCLVDFYRPSVGFAAARLLRDAGCSVSAPPATCCGQPAYNAGDRATTRRLAERVIAAFSGTQDVVVPSGSCAAMLRLHYPRLFKGDSVWLARAEQFAARVFELTAYLVDVLMVKTTGAVFEKSVTYHDACAGLRELGIREQPRKLLRQVEGLRLHELAAAEECCGFGGTFCVKYPKISLRMVTEKCTDIVATGAHTICAGDMGCLLNIAGRLGRQGARVRTRHVAEILAGTTESPATGEP